MRPRRTSCSSLRQRWRSAPCPWRRWCRCWPCAVRAAGGPLYAPRLATGTAETAAAGGHCDSAPGDGGPTAGAAHCRRPALGGCLDPGTAHPAGGAGTDAAVLCAADASAGVSSPVGALGVQHAADAPAAGAGAGRSPGDAGGGGQGAAGGGSRADSGPHRWSTAVCRRSDPDGAGVRAAGGA